MSRAKIVLTGEERRVEAAKWISNAPIGTRVEFKAPRRSLPQNDRMWAMLSDVSTQLHWHGQHLTANDWKLVFLDALDKETRTVPDIYGIGRVNLGRSSSDLSKDEMSQLMELMAAFGSQHGVKFHDDPIDHMEPKVRVKRDTAAHRKQRQDILSKHQAPKLTRAEVMAKARAAKAAKAVQKPADKASKPIVVEFVTPPKTSPKPSTAEPVVPGSIRKTPATTDDYVAYAQAQILANRGKVSPAIMETWFLSPHEVRLRQDCKVGQLATQLLHSLIKQCADSEPA